jgi:hypothetical protein
MAIKAAEILDRVRTILQDTTSGGMRWKDEEMLQWLNDGQREVALLKPDATAVNDDVKLIAGTLQSIPDGGISLLNITRNMGTDGASPGKAVRIVDRDILDIENPNWHIDTANSEVLHYVYDTDDPEHFWVYPPQPTANMGYINMVYSSSPAAVANFTATTSITIPDIYSNQLVDYMLFRCYSKDAGYAGNAERANTHLNLFRQSLGAKTNVETVKDPNNRISESKAS